MLKPILWLFFRDFFPTQNCNFFRDFFFPVTFFPTIEVIITSVEGAEDGTEVYLSGES